MSCELSQERDVGITEYMTADLPAFTAILKHRFRDFQVNEVDLQGQEAVLTSLDPPRLPQPLPLRDLTDEVIQSASRSFAALAGAENGKRLTALLHWVKTKHGPKAPQQEPQCAKPEQQQVKQQQQQQAEEQQQQQQQQQVEQQQVEQQQQQEEQQQQQQQQKGQQAVEAAAAGAAAATPEPATLSPTEAVEAHPSPQPDSVSSTGNARAAQPSSGPNAPASSLGKRPADILAGPAPPTQPLVGQQSAGCDAPQGSGSPWTGVVMDKHGVAYVDLEPLPDRDTRTAVHSFFRHNPEVILLCTHTLTNESSSSSSNNNNPAGQAGGRGRGRGSSQPPANKKARHTNQMSGRGHHQQQQQAADVEPSQVVASADGAVAASLQAAGDTKDTPAAVTAAVADQDAATPAAPSTTVPAAGAVAVAAGPAIQQPLPTVAAASVTHTTAPSAGCIRVQFHPPGGHGQQQGRGQGGRGRGRGRGQPADQEWGGGPTKKYVKFVMYKENMDIQVALGSLAQGLYLPRWASPWGYAGSKDKRGVTQQLMTA
ncbi:hypothetical protein QJQ45_021013 [Haematococcus lacustris]|nr:hypothetical protein QJQ45_021013 [Haematococcus lacustris]